MSDRGDPIDGSRRAPRVCITMPVYNGERFILEALDSVLTQDYPDVVVRVIDNASTDGTRELLSGIEDPRVSVEHFDEHVPVAANFARAAAQGCGEYTMFLAVDDRLAPGALGALVAAAETHPECALVFGRTVVVHHGARPRMLGVALRPPRVGFVGDLEDYVLRNGYNIPLSTILFRRETPGFEIDPATRHACDLDLLVRLSRHGATGFGIRAPVLYLRQHDDAISENGALLSEVTLETLLQLKRTARNPRLYRMRARRVLLWALVRDRDVARELFAKFSMDLGLSRRSLPALLIRLPWLGGPLLVLRRVWRFAWGGIPIRSSRDSTGTT